MLIIIFSLWLQNTTLIRQNRLTMETSNNLTYSCTSIIKLFFLQMISLTIILEISTSCWSWSFPNQNFAWFPCHMGSVFSTLILLIFKSWSSLWLPCRYILVRILGLEKFITYPCNYIFLNVLSCFPHKRKKNKKDEYIHHFLQILNHNLLCLGCCF